MTPPFEQFVIACLESVAPDVADILLETNRGTDFHHASASFLNRDTHIVYSQFPFERKRLDFKITGNNINWGVELCTANSAGQKYVREHCYRFDPTLRHKETLEERPDMCDPEAEQLYVPGSYTTGNLTNFRTINFVVDAPTEGVLGLVREPGLVFDRLRIVRPHSPVNNKFTKFTYYRRVGGEIVTSEHQYKYN